MNSHVAPVYKLRYLVESVCRMRRWSLSTNISCRLGHTFILVRARCSPDADPHLRLQAPAQSTSVPNLRQLDLLNFVSIHRPTVPSTMVHLPRNGRLKYSQFLWVLSCQLSAAVLSKHPRQFYSGGFTRTRVSAHS